MRPISAYSIDYNENRENHLASKEFYDFLLYVFANEIFKIITQKILI